MYPIITISREFGSGGHSIGQKVAEQLNIPFYDSMIVEKVAEESGYDKKVISEQGEYSTRANTFFGNLAAMTSRAPYPYYESPQDKIFAIQSQIIRDLAEKGPCVIVGRCADFVLRRDGHLMLNVFIHADMKYRMSHVVSRYGETDVNIEKRLEQKDRNRRTYYKFYTDQQWGDYHNYQLALDSGLLGEDACKDIILLAAKQLNEKDT